MKVDFNPNRSYHYGMYVSFVADDFTMSPGLRRGVFTFTVTGDDWRSGTTGAVNFFMPAASPAHLHRTLDDVKITVDGSEISATTSSTSDAGQPGRLWSFTVPFSTHTIDSDADPPVSVGGVLMPVNKVTVLAPYLALVGVIAAEAVVVAAPWKKRKD